MQHSQVLVFESDGKLADILRPLARTHGTWLRELRQPQSCLSVLGRAGSGLLVLKIGRDLERELALLQELAWSFPDCRIIVVGDVDHPSLADLAWDLGAAFVVLPPAGHDILLEIVAHMLTTNHD